MSTFSINEVEQDLFTTPKHYALAHCISRDAAMGAGIAKQFMQHFPNLRNAVKAHGDRKIGDAIRVYSGERTIINLITKHFYYNKPTYITFQQALNGLRNVVVSEAITHLAIPYIGCVLDKLEWEKVRPMIEQTFADVNVEILVCAYKEPVEIIPAPDNVLAFTGHRPKDIFNSYDPYEPRNKAFLMQLRALIEKNIVEHGVDTFITGMALGVDMWAARIVLALKQKYPHIKLIAAIPCKEQDSRWIGESKREYADILAKCDEQHLLFDGTFEQNKGCMNQRNRWMVNKAGRVIAVWTGKENGGTWDCVKYAREQDRNITYLNPHTLQISQ